MRVGSSSGVKVVKLVGDACEGIVQVPPLRGVLRSGCAQSRAPAVLLQGAVSQGAQGRQSASMAESSAERGLLLRTGECGASAGVAGGASGVLEAAAQAESCLARPPGFTTCCEQAYCATRRGTCLTRHHGEANPCDGGAYRASHRKCLTRRHRTNDAPAALPGPGRIGQGHPAARLWKNT